MTASTGNDERAPLPRDIHAGYHFDKWRKNFVGQPLLWEAFAAGRASLGAAQVPAQPVAEIVECSQMGQQTLREIDGRWKFLPYGTKLYAQSAGAAQVPAGSALVSEDWLKKAEEAIYDMELFGHIWSGEEWCPTKPISAGAAQVPSLSDAPISKAEWRAAAKAVYIEDGGDDEATAEECARYICLQQDWFGEVDDPAYAAREDLLGRGRPSAGAAQVPSYPHIKLLPHEIQSGHDRVRWAEGLIRQLPETHDGRNSWLLNYAAGSQLSQEGTK